MKILLNFLLRLCFGYKLYNKEITNVQGPAILTPNHVSWLDFILVFAALGDGWKFAASKSAANRSWLHRIFMINKHTFLIDPASPYAMRDMAQFLTQGGKLVIFPEGRLSTTGSLMKVYDGTGFLLHATQAKIFTCYLRNANRCKLAKHSGWKQWFPNISLHFKNLVPPSAQGSGSNIRLQYTNWLREEMMNIQFLVESEFGAKDILSSLVTVGKHIPKQIILEDITEQPLTYKQLLLAVQLFSQHMPKDGKYVGILLPNVAVTPITIFALMAAQKVPAMLNFSSGIKTILACCQLASVRTIITSRSFLTKAKLDANALMASGLTLCYVEDIKSAISPWSKALALVSYKLNWMRWATFSEHDTAIILFTSGSEGIPKGVELSHRNLLANVRQATAVIDVTDHDRFFNAMPLFHSFGLTGGLLFPMLRGCYTFLFPTPLAYRAIPSVIYDKNCTVVFGTNTFLTGYAKKAHPYDFQSVKYLIAGAEKVQQATFDIYAKRFGIRILEGYGATECSPLISVNTRMEPCVGSAGKLIPGLEYRLEPVPGVEKGGRLFVRGANVMKGYINAEANQTFQSGNGWYDTGDIVYIDADKQLFIQGRMKRFAKISGEMVSLTAVEDALAGAFTALSARAEIAVIARPDEHKGEILIAYTNETKITLKDIREVIRQKGLNNLCAPREICYIAKIPKLGTGKVNHRELSLSAQKT